ncbi:MAG: nitroreductase family protein [Dehalococcoidia bacterium]|nr:nitroreductase family protein [Dehalococcoidia bacterium]
MLEIQPYWYPAINVRRSRRQYQKDRPIAAEARQRLHEVCSGFRPFNGVRVEFIDEPPDDIFANALGFYGNIKNAPAFLAFIGDTSNPNMQEKMGYTGEAAILGATSLDLGTCWVALTYNTRAVKSIIKLEKTEKLICVSPVGHTTEKWSFEEKVLTGFGSNHQRKPLTAMVSGLPQSSWPAWARSAVEAARLAPSAMNRQPWGFLVEEHSITVYVKDRGPEFNVARRLDCGIAMLHIELGALNRGATGNWDFLTHPQVARFSVK